MANSMLGNIEILDCAADRCRQPFPRTVGSKRDKCAPCRALIKKEKALKDLLDAEKSYAEALAGQRALVNLLTSRGAYVAPVVEDTTFLPEETPEQAEVAA